MTTRIKITVTEAMLDELRRVSKQQDMTVSRYIRCVLSKDLIGPPRKHRDNDVVRVGRPQTHKQDEA